MLRLPQRWRAWAEPHFKQFAFYAVCARIALRYVWEDRHAMLREATLVVFFASPNYDSALASAARGEGEAHRQRY